jgi:hypothetical protein
LRERWNRPVEVIDIEWTSDQAIWLPDGRVQRAPVFTLTEDSIERIRLGYVCAKCFQVFERAWPERCHFCGAPIRTKQAEFFAKEFGGEEDLSPTSIDDEVARMHEQVERDKREENRS